MKRDELGVELAVLEQENTNGQSGSCRSAAGKNARRGRLVEDRPEHAEVLDGLEEFLEADGFHDEGVDAELVAADHIPLLARRGQHHYRRIAHRRVALELLEHL